MSDTPLDPPTPQQIRDAVGPEDETLLRMRVEAQRRADSLNYRLRFLGFTPFYVMREVVGTTCRVCGACVVLTGAGVEPPPGFGQPDTGWAEAHRSRCEAVTG